MPSNFEITAELSFQPTLPLRGATAPMPLIAVCNPFQPTLPLRGATTVVGQFAVPIVVSTHAPLAGSDAYRPSCRQIA